MFTERSLESAKVGMKTMQKKIITHILSILVFISCAGSLAAPYAANFFRGHDYGFLPLFDAGKRKFVAGSAIEHGFSSRFAYNGEGDQVDLMKMYADKQSSQAMLSDPVIVFPQSEDPEQWFVNTVQQPYNDDWGMFDVTGKFQETNVTLWARGKLALPETIPGSVSLAAYVPIKVIRIDGVLWKDLSDPYALGAEERMNGFTSRLSDFVNVVGSLDLSNWSKVGQGDTTLMLEWQHEFKQELDLIQHVRLEGAFGVLVPTERMLDSDIDQSFAVSLGSGGAWGIPLKGSLEVQMHQKLSAGVCVDMLWLSDVTKPRRLKTHLNQTEYLLLSKGRARLQHARTWRFNLFSRLQLPVEGLWASFSYHFAKTGDHTLIPEDNDFNSTVVNSAESIKESSSHDLLFKIHYSKMQSDTFATPGVSLFVKFPVGGCRMVKNVTFGGECMFAF